MKRTGSGGVERLGPAASDEEPRGARGAWIVLGLALAGYATALTGFDARPTDLSALRVLAGEVPYRDFWTIYAPGSFVTLAAAFRLFGRELIVSNALGIVTSAAATALYFRLSGGLAPRAVRWVLAGLLMVAFWGTGYQVGFTSFPPAFLCIVAGGALAAQRASRAGVVWAVAPGLLFGAAALFKHDIAAYAALAAGAGVVAARWATGAARRLAPAVVLGAAAAAVPVAAALVLVALGAGADLWRDLIVFPLTDFPLTRPEFLPVLPPLGRTLESTVRGLVPWASGALPLVAVTIAGVAGFRRRRELDASATFLVVFAVSLTALHWVAAHVQINTNAISLAAWGGLAASVGWRGRSGLAGKLARATGYAWLAVWAGLLVARPVAMLLSEGRPSQWVELPGLTGIQSARTGMLRELADAIAEAAPPDAPLVVLGNRNDILVFAASVPYWLSPRPWVTRHHELHPGITDTESVQREMIDDLEDGPPPVVVREHRFGNPTLQRVLREMRAQGVRNGSTLLDDWLAEHYEPGRRYGRYEVLRRRPAGVSD